jgi:hypothetical protein
MALDEARHLHGQRRAAGDDAAMAGELPGGAGQGAHVDAAVLEVALVLECHEHREVTLVDVGRLHRKSPAAVGCRESTQQPVAAVEYRRGDLLGLSEGGRPDAVDDDVGGGEAYDGGAGKGAGADQGSPPVATRSRGGRRGAVCLPAAGCSPPGDGEQFVDRGAHSHSRLDHLPGVTVSLPAAVRA